MSGSPGTRLVSPSWSFSTTGMRMTLQSAWMGSISVESASALRCPAADPGVPEFVSVTSTGPAGAAAVEGDTRPAGTVDTAEAAGTDRGFVSSTPPSSTFLITTTTHRSHDHICPINPLVFFFPKAINTSKTTTAPSVCHSLSLIKKVKSWLEILPFVGTMLQIKTGNREIKQISKFQPD